MRNPSCNRCSLHAATSYVCLWGEGPRQCRVMLVGEAPGEDEEKKGRPFVGPAGRLLDSALHDAGIKRSDIYITNIVKCHPPMNRTPNKEEHNACMWYLVEEIQEVQPEVIVCLGGSAAKALTGANAVASARGKKLTTRRELGFNLPVYVTYHPSAALRGGGQISPMYTSLVEDLRSIAGPSERNGIQDGEKHRRALFYANDSQASRAIDYVAASGQVTVDLEWLAGNNEMLWPWNPSSRCLSIAISGRKGDEVLSAGMALPLHESARDALIRALTDCKVIAHNGTSDSLWLRALALPYRIDGDTMLLAHALDEEQPLGLESLAQAYVYGMGEWKTPLWYRPPDSLDEWNALLRYNTDDTLATLLLWEALQEKGSDQDRRIHDHLLMPALKTLTAAAWHGVPIDYEALREARIKTEETRTEHIARLSNITGLPGTDASKLATSPERTKLYLSSAEQITVPDSSRDTLAEVQNQSIAIPEILGIRRQTKYLSTYLDPWMGLLLRQGDGRLHTIYRIHGTRTGRLSAELEQGGSLQVTPRDQWVRDLIKAPDGRRIIAADYSQIELRVIAYLSRDETMLGLFQNNEDLHTTTAALMLAMREEGLGIDAYWPQRERWMSRIDKKSEERQAAKGVNFGLAFGMQSEKLQTYARTKYSVELTDEESEMAVQGFFQLYPRLADWHRDMAFKARQEGHVTTPFGRRRYVGGEATKAINTPVQSSASDITLLAMSAVDRRIEREALDAHVIGAIHDSVLVEAAEHHADAVEAAIVEEMPNVDTGSFGFEIDVPLPVEVKSGQTWA